MKKLIFTPLVFLAALFIMGGCSNGSDEDRDFYDTKIVGTYNITVPAEEHIRWDTGWRGYLVELYLGEVYRDSFEIEPDKTYSILYNFELWVDGEVYPRYTPDNYYSWSLGYSEDQTTKETLDTVITLRLINNEPKEVKIVVHQTVSGSYS